MTVQVKICGLTNTEDACAAIHQGASYIGFVFASSPRQVSVETAQKIVADLTQLQCLHRVTTVGVFVNEKPENIQAILQTTGITCAQLHGNETSRDANTYQFAWYKALRIASLQDIDSYITSMKPAWKCPILLADAFVKDLYGGTGIVIPCEIAQQTKIHVHNQKKQFMLAGGITPENVKNVMLGIQPDIIDVSSGIELHKGKKSQEKLEQLFREINSVENINESS